MSKSEDRRQSRSDRARTRAEMRDWIPAVVLIVVLGVIAETVPTGKLWWSLANIVPALWIVRAVVRALRRADEYQRIAQLEALALGFGAMAMALFVAGLLEAADVGVLRQSTQISFIGGVLVWVVALLVKTQRVR
jgi:hypothetical protein